MQISKAIPSGITRDNVPLLKVWRSDSYNIEECPIFPSYFIKESDINEMTYGTKLSFDFFKHAVNLERNWGTLYGSSYPVAKVSWYSDEQRRETRKLLKSKFIETLQSDRSMIQQWFTEKDVEVLPLSQIKPMGFDIEVDARSVVGSTLVTVAYKDTYSNIRIDELFRTFKLGMKTIAVRDDNKICLSNITRVIRHNSGKKLFKITLNSGKYVIVTEDHSLLEFKNSIITVRPEELVINKSLIPVVPNEIHECDRFPYNNKYNSTKICARSRKKWNDTCFTNSDDKNLQMVQKRVCNNMEIQKHRMLFKLVRSKIQNYACCENIYNNMYALRKNYIHKLRLTQLRHRRQRKAKILQQKMCSISCRQNKIQIQVMVKKQNSNNVGYRSSTLRPKTKIFRQNVEKMVRSCICKTNAYCMENKTKFLRNISFKFTQGSSLCRSRGSYYRAKTTRLRFKKSNENYRVVWRAMAPQIRSRASCVVVPEIWISNSNNMGQRCLSQTCRSTIYDSRFFEQQAGLDRVADIKCVGVAEDFVYDLEVEGTHTFAANGIMVHNSGFPDVLKGNQRLLAICCADTKGNEFKISDDDEVSMFEKFNDVIKNYDIGTGWNIKHFDLPYLRVRAFNLGASLDTRRISWLDAMALYAKTSYARGESINLEDTSRRELGRDIKQGFEGRNLPLEMWQSFSGNKEAVTTYCLEDAKAALDIFTLPKLSIADLYIRMSQITHIPYEDVLYPSKVIDSPAIKYLNSKGICFPDARFHYDLGDSRFGATYEGAVVFEPKIGLHNAVAVEDFSSMYARMVMIFNLASDAIVNEENFSDSDTIAPETEVHFTKDKLSDIVPILKFFEAEKLRYRALKQKGIKERGEDDPQTKLDDMTSEAYKVMLLSTYGVFGDTDSRYFRQEVAESITAFGRWLLGATRKAAESIGLVVVYGDTDSIFIEHPTMSLDEFKKNLPELENHINSIVLNEMKTRFGISEKDFPIYDILGKQVIGDLTVKQDYLFRRFFIPAKKEYIGMRLMPDGSEKIFSRGMGRNRYNTFTLATESEEEIFTKVFTIPDIKTAHQAVKTYFNDVKPKLFSGKLDDKLVIRSKLSMSLKSYTTDLPYVRAAKMLDAQGLYRDGDVIRYVINGTIKGKLQVAPVYRDIPHISYSGYLYYLERIQKWNEEVFGREQATANLLTAWGAKQ